MVVGVLCKDGTISDHFEDTKEVLLYEIDRTHEIVEKRTLAVEGEGHLPVAGILIKNQANAVICDEIKMNAFSMMRNLRAHVFIHAKGDPDEAIQALLRRELKELKAQDCPELEHEEGCTGNCSSCAYH